LVAYATAARHSLHFPSGQSAPADEPTAAVDPLTILIVVPTLDIGASDAGAAELVRILAGAGHRPIVVSRGGRLEADIAASGGKIVHMDVASNNPAIMLRNVHRIVRLVRTHRCDVIHAHGRAAGWSAYCAARMMRVPFLTSWYKGFREQNGLKRLYNSVMVRGERVIAVSDQIAELITERYGTPSDRIAVVPASVDVDRFDPASVSPERIEAVRQSWEVTGDTKVILVVGRMIRRKGHDVVVRAVRRMRDMGLTDFLCVFVGEDQGRTRYVGELWDLVLATDSADLIRMEGAAVDLPAAFAAATVVVSASVQAEGLQRAILEAQAMARPVVVSELGAGRDVVLAPPTVAEDRMTGLRFSAGDDAALAAAVIRLFTFPERVRRAIGMRGREWVLAHFNDRIVAKRMLDLYADITPRRKSS
jgi:glycosyltransferase involved in cell wall biosynthesis